MIAVLSAACAGRPATAVQDEKPGGLVAATAEAQQSEPATTTESDSRAETYETGAAIVEPLVRAGASAHVWR
jgi:hypothetical protein